ncbi:MAG: DUF2182 domain-containing protein [Hahellaceae bacterium]|nr:DUF2182 domain-containing protein [Hahellaceae bacterium]
MNMAPIGQWHTVDVFMLFAMWAIMMAGMMLPSATPVILWVNRINQQRRRNHTAYIHTLYFVSGYLWVWSLFSGLITLLQWWLHSAALLSPMMMSANRTFSALLLITAGLYQWSPLKQQCLRLCQSPLSLISTQWREGHWGAIRLGLIHGQYCVGCCWALMVLLFITGVMNLKWILLITLFVMIEKLLSKGEWFARLTGVVLVGLGVGLLV